MAKKLAYLGVDMGASALKIVEMVNDKGRPRLVTYGFAEYGAEYTAQTDVEADKERLISLLKDLRTQTKAKAVKAFSAIPNFSVFSSVISLPGEDAKDLLPLIRKQTAKLLPSPIEEYTLDWKVVRDGSSRDEAAREGGKTDIRRGKDVSKRVLVTAAPRKIVQAYMEIFKGAGLSLLGLETESFALMRSLVGRDTSPMILIDVGAVTTDIIVIDQGIPALNRSIHVGGIDVTRAIGRGMGMDARQAEQFKRDMDKAPPQGKALPAVIEQSLSLVLNEITYAVELFGQQSLERKIGKAILTGGSAFLPNLKEHVGDMLKVKAFVGDPWARVIYPEELRPALEAIGPRFAVASGLAMRDIA